MQILYSHLRRIKINRLPEPIKFKFCLFSFSSLTKTQNPNNSFWLSYLIETFNFPKEKARFLSKRFKYVKSPAKPQSVVDYLQKLGLSQTHIRSSVRVRPEILVLDIDKILKPKIEFLQQLGLVGSHLGKVISKNPLLLTVSLENRLIPNIEILKKTLVNDKNNVDLIKVIRKGHWVVSVDPKRRLLSNIEYFESCGIVGSQLSLLLKRQPRLFATEGPKLRELVSRTLDMGFSVNSRMFVHGFYTVSFYSEKTIERKLQLLRTFGFSKDECMNMFRRAPGLLWTSEEKLKLGLEFFSCKMLMKREVLFHNPMCLMLSLEGRVIPRYKVLQILKLKRLLKKEPSLLNVVSLTEEAFLEKFVLKFRDDAEELLAAYKGHMLDSTSSTLSKEEDLEETGS